MIDAEMYGMIPSANTVNLDKAPPDIRLAMPRIPPSWPLKNCCNCAGSIPGTGMCAPTRYTTSANNKNNSRRRRSPNLPVFASCAALVATLTSCALVAESGDAAASRFDGGLGPGGCADTI